MSTAEPPSCAQKLTAQLSFRGQAIPIDQLEFIDESWIEMVEAQIQGATMKSEGGTYNDPTKPNEPKKRNGSGEK